MYTHEMLIAQIRDGVLDWTALEHKPSEPINIKLLIDILNTGLVTTLLLNNYWCNYWENIDKNDLFLFAETLKSKKISISVDITLVSPNLKAATTILTTIKDCIIISLNLTTVDCTLVPILTLLKAGTLTEFNLLNSVDEQDANSIADVLKKQ